MAAGEELFANMLFPTASELEQMLQASDNWTLGCVHTVCVGTSVDECLICTLTSHMCVHLMCTCASVYVTMCVRA